MQARDLLQRKYIVYGLSIVMSRGLELAVMFFAAKYLAKAVYGDLEFYKKLLELGGVLLSFGFPTMILTYTRSRASKVYMLLFASVFVVIFSLVLWPVLRIWGWEHLWLSFLFYALFFTGGIYPVYVLVRKGSDAASVYKITVSVLFYGGVWWYIVHSPAPSEAFVRTAKWLVVPGMAIMVWEWMRFGVIWRHFRRYARLFLRLLYGSFTVVLSSFSNMMFLYTDIFIIKWMSEKASLEIADYGFSLNVANILMLIPLTLVQADIEKIKREKSYFGIIRKKILVLALAGALVLIPAYYLLTHRYYVRYDNTFGLFLVIMIAKLFQSQSVLYGAGILISKKYNVNLFINLFMIVLNVVLSYSLYKIWGLYGVATASALSLAVRYGLLVYAYHHWTRRT